MEKKFIVYGAGSYALQFIKELEYFNMQLPVAIAVDKQFIKESEHFGIKIVEFETVEYQYPPEKYDMIVFGPTSKIRLRKVMYDKAKAKGYKLANYISPGAFVSKDVIMGDNIVICRGADVGYGGTMGSDVFIRNGVYLGHEFKLKSHIVIAPGCVIGGDCRIGNYCWVGLGATVRNSITVGDDALIGMGAVVTKNVEPAVSVVGCPARVVSHHEEFGVDLSRHSENGTE